MHGHRTCLGTGHGKIMPESLGRMKMERLMPTGTARGITMSWTLDSTLE